MRIREQKEEIRQKRPQSEKEKQEKNKKCNITEAIRTAFQRRKIVNLSSDTEVRHLS